MTVRRPTLAPPASVSPRVTTTRLLELAYLFTLAGTAAVVAMVAPRAIGPTLLATIVAWCCLTAALHHNHRASGRGAIVALTVVLLMRNYAGLGLEARGWAVVTMVVLSAPFVLVPLPRCPGFPFLHIWCVLEGIYVYVSVTLSLPITVHASIYTPEVRTNGYRVLAVFTCLVVTSGVAVLRSLRSRPQSLEAPTVATSVPTSAIPRAYALAIASAVTIGMISYLGAADRLGQAGQVIKIIGFGGGLVLVLLWLDGRLSPGHKGVLVAAAALLFFAGLGSAALYVTAIPGLLVFALWVGRRRRVPWLGLLLTLVVLIPLNVGKGEYREVAWASGQSGRQDVFGLGWIDSTLDRLGSLSDTEVGNSANRFANSDLLGYVTTWAPERYPYVGYGVYTDIPTILVPRLLLPSKGSFNIANEFGRTYELIARSNVGTSVNTPLPVEAYIAGGMVALVTIGLLSGAAMAWFGHLLRGREPATVIVGALLGLQIMSTVESGILGFVLVLPFMIILRPLLTWVCGGKPPGRHEAPAAPAAPRAGVIGPLR